MAQAIDTSNSAQQQTPRSRASIAITEEMIDNEQMTKIYDENYEFKICGEALECGH